MRTRELWPRIHAERARLADDLAALGDEQWATPSLCGEWSVRETLAHLTAVSTMTMLPWLRSVVGARWDFDLHNERRMREQLGAGPSDTLEQFRAHARDTTRILGPAPAALGEFVIHGEDIRRPLGIAAGTTPERAAELLRWFATHEFAVISKTRVEGLRLRATDSELDFGDGPLVEGPALSLLMATVGRAAHLQDLNGDGVQVLAARCAATWKRD